MMNFKDICKVVLCCVLLVSTPTIHTHAQVGKVVKSVSKIFGKKAGKEIAGETAEKVAKEVAQGAVKKAGKEIAEETAEQALKRISKEVAETTIKKNVADALFASSKTITKKTISEVAPVAIKKTMLAQLSKEISEKALKTTSKEFAQQIGKKTSEEASQQFLKRIGTGGSQEMLESSGKKSFKSLKDDAIEITNKLKKEVQQPVSKNITRAQKEALQKLTTLGDDIAKFKKATSSNSKAEALLNIKRKLDNAPDIAEKQKIINNLPDDIKKGLNKLNDGRRNPLPIGKVAEGKWQGARGNSYYILDPQKTPRKTNYGNTRNLSMQQIIDENNLQRGVRYKDGYPDFSPYEMYHVEIDFDKALKGVKSKEREILQEKAFQQLAEKLGKSVDEVKVMKGDATAANRLAKKWGCSESEVWQKLNPQRRHYVWHEEPDCKTLRLIPSEVHENFKHGGGISVYKILNDIAQ